MAASRLKEAFCQEVNLIGLAAFGAAAGAMLSPVPILAGIVAEVGYLLFAPDSAWIRSKTARKNREAEEQQRLATRNALYATLGDELREQFDRLMQKRRDIEAATRADPAWESTDLLQNLEYLLDKYLAFASKEVQYREYLQNIRDDEQIRVRPPRGSSRDRSDQPAPVSDATLVWVNRLVDEVSGRYRAEIEHIQAEAERENDADARAVLDKRVQVLQQRDDYLRRASRAIVNIRRQLGLLEDAFGLINDQIRARPPDQIKADLDGVLQTTQMMTKTLDEMAQFEQTLTVGTQS